MNKEEHKVRISNNEVKDVTIEYGNGVPPKITIEDFNLPKTPTKEEIIKK